MRSFISQRLTDQTSPVRALVQNMDTPTRQSSGRKCGVKFRGSIRLEPVLKLVAFFAVLLGNVEHFQGLFLSQIECSNWADAASVFAAYRSTPLGPCHFWA